MQEAPDIVIYVYIFNVFIHKTCLVGEYMAYYTDPVFVFVFLFLIVCNSST